MNKLRQIKRCRLVCICILLLAFVSSLFRVEVEASGVSQITGTIETVSANSNNVVLPLQTKSYINIQGRYWSFFCNATGELYYSSSTSGSNWETSVEIQSQTVLAGEDVDVAFDGTNFHVVTFIHSGDGMYYRMGTPLSNGSISWVTDWQTILASENDVCYPVNMEIDSQGYPWLAYRIFSNDTLRVAKSDWKNGSWSTSSGFPHSFEDPIYFKLLSLTSNKMYLLRAIPGSHLKGTLWNGTSWGNNETVVYYDSPETPPYLYGGDSWTAISYGDDVFVAIWGCWDADWTQYRISMRRRTYGVGWGTHYNVTDISGDKTLKPLILSTFSGTRFWIFWIENFKIWYRTTQSIADWGTVNSTLLTETGIIFNSYEFNGNSEGFQILIVYGVRTSSSTIKSVIVSGQYTYYFQGVYDEDTGLFLSPSNRAVNVTAYFTTSGVIPATFEVNGTYTYNSLDQPQYFLFNLTDPRQYWIGTTENTSTIYIFYAPNSVVYEYTIQFADLGGILNDYSFITAERYINGTLRTIEKRKVDVENKLQMHLVNGVKYTINVEDGATYEFGDLLMTTETSITLTLKGIEFPQNIILAHRYVRQYAERHNNFSSISCLYQDLDEDTNYVDIFINYKNGTNAYNTTQTSVNSFNVTWTSANYNITYIVQMNAYHNDYGTLNYRAVMQRGGYNFAPFNLDWLGTIPGMTTSDLIPIGLILFVAAVFSKVNAYVAAFLASGVAIFLTSLGFISIAPGLLMMAIFFSILMAMAYKKRRVIGA